MGPLHNEQALLFILLIVCQATIRYTPDFHQWKAIFPLVESLFSARKFFTSRTKTKKFSRHVFGSME